VRKTVCSIQNVLFIFTKISSRFVIANCQLEVTLDDEGLLVADRIGGQFEQFHDEILENDSQLDGCTGTNRLDVASLGQWMMKVGEVVELQAWNRIGGGLDLHFVSNAATKSSGKQKVETANC